MTQEEAIDNLCDVVGKELVRLNAKVQQLIDIYREGITVYIEEVPQE